MSLTFHAPNQTKLEDTMVKFPLHILLIRFVTCEQVHQQVNVSNKFDTFLQSMLETVM